MHPKLRSDETEEEEESEHLEKALRAPRQSPAPKCKKVNGDLEEGEKFGRFERNQTVTLSLDADEDAMSDTVATAAFEAQMQYLESMELVDRKVIAAIILGWISPRCIRPRELPRWPSDTVWWRALRWI